MQPTSDTGGAIHTPRVPCQGEEYGLGDIFGVFMRKEASGHGVDHGSVTPDDFLKGLASPFRGEFGEQGAIGPCLMPGLGHLHHNHHWRRGAMSLEF